MADVCVVIRGLDAETAARLVGDLRRSPGLLGRASFEIGSGEASADAVDRLRDAISGERRYWHEVEVRPDDIAAVLGEADRGG